jgi:hypothetical protein
MRFLNFLLSFFKLSATYETTFFVWINDMSKSDTENSEKIEEIVGLIITYNSCPLKNGSAKPCKRGYINNPTHCLTEHKDLAVGFEIKAEMPTEEAHKQCIDMFKKNKISYLANTRLVVNKKFR